MEGDYRKGINKEGTVDSWLWQALLGPNKLNGRNSEDSVDDDDDDFLQQNEAWKKHSKRRANSEPPASVILWVVVSSFPVNSCDLRW